VVRADLRFDEGYHFPEGTAQGGIIVPHFGKITARIMLSPELIRQIVREVFERGKSRVNGHCLGNLGSQIMNPA
jgi:hypothetical protein